MIRLLLLCLVAGCASAPRKEVRTAPIRIGTTWSGGYQFEVWENPDGTMYLQRGAVRMEIHQGGEKRLTSPLR